MAGTVIFKNSVYFMQMVTMQTIPAAFWIMYWFHYFQQMHKPDISHLNNFPLERFTKAKSFLKNIFREKKTFLSRYIRGRKADSWAFLPMVWRGEWNESHIYHSFPFFWKLVFFLHFTFRFLGSKQAPFLLAEAFMLLLILFRILAYDMLRAWTFIVKRWQSYSDFFIGKCIIKSIKCHQVSDLLGFVYYLQDGWQICFRQLFSMCLINMRKIEKENNTLLI